MNILRVEHRETRIGPYSFDGNAAVPRYVVAEALHSNQAYDPIDHPTPDTEFGWSWYSFVRNQRHALFGFRDVEQLRRWFPRVELLVELGFQIVAYRVPDESVRLSPTQLIFDFTEAWKVGVVPASTEN